MTDKELMEQALEALEKHAMQRTYAGGVYIANVAIALRERLAQPEQEPIAWRFRFPNGKKWHYTEHGPNEYTRPKLSWEPLSLSLRERLAHCDRCGKKLGGEGHIHTCSPQVQEPVAWLHPANATCVTTDPTAYARGIPLYTAQQPVQEPVIDKSAAIRIATALGWEPRREWQGLTVAQIEEAFQQSAGADEDTHIRFARAIEAKLKEKNT